MLQTKGDLLALLILFKCIFICLLLYMQFCDHYIAIKCRLYVFVKWHVCFVQ